jgi:outer membrane biogenesis lipoprotein LolB
MNSALHRIVVFVIVAMFACSASSELRAQQSNERVLKKQTVKKVAKSIEKLAK